MSIFVVVMLFVIYLYSKIDEKWYFRFGVTFTLFNIPYLVASYYTELYGSEISETLFEIYLVFFLFFFIIYFGFLIKFRKILVVEKIHEGDIPVIRYRTVLYFLGILAFIFYLSSIVPNDLYSFLLMSTHEQKRLMQEGNRLSIDLFLFSIYFLILNFSSKKIQIYELFISCLYFLLILIVFGRNPSMFYLFGLCFCYLYKKNRNVSFLFCISTIFVGCIFMGFINARRAVGTDLLLIYEHVARNGFVTYIFGTEFNVPARILYFMESDNLTKELFNYPGYSLFVISINSIVPGFIWDRLDTLSRELSIAYGTTGGLPLILEFYGNSNRSLVSVWAVVFAVFSFLLDLCLSRVTKLNKLFGFLLVTTITFSALNATRIDMAIIFKMFIVCMILSAALSYILRRL